MRVARFLRLACCCAALLAHSEYASAAVRDDVPPPGYRPSADSDEGGIWYQFDEAERLVSQSPALVRDEKLNRYVKNLVCELAGPQCGSLRVYVMDIPIFNATCAPNGMVEVYTGLLMRAENEAQLAFVLGHEITHYLNRHGLGRHRTERDLSNALSFLSLGLAGAGGGLGVPLGGVGSLAQMIAAGAYFSYSREQETEADAGGFEMAVAHGYDPRQGAAIWRNVEDEQAANPKRKTGSLFYSSHPTNKTRIAAMNKRADDMANLSHSENLGIESYREAVLPHRFQWLQEEVDRAQYAESIYVIGELLKRDTASGELNYFLAEAYRRRNGKGDGEKALAAYRAAIAAADAPVVAYRGLGIAALKAGNAEANTSLEAFGKYLSLAPDAKDRATVEYYLATLGAKK